MSVTPVLAADAYGPCQSLGTQNHFWESVTLDPSELQPATTFRGVKANAWSRSRIQTCTTGWDRTSTYWISLVPAPGNPNNSIDTILQIGVIQCGIDFAPGSICDDGGETQKWIFYAKGGCAGIQPTTQKIAVAPDGGVDLEIHRNTGASYTLQYSTASEGGSITVQGADPAISCWLTGSGDNASVQIACERFDLGDGCGYDISPVTLQNIYVQKAVNGGWYNPGFSQSDCRISAIGGSSNTNGHCFVYSSNKVQFWTTQ